MIRRKRVQFRVEVYIRGINPDSCALRIGDIYICMNLCHRHSQGWPPVYDGMLTEQYDLARRRGFGHTYIKPCEGSSGKLLGKTKIRKARPMRDKRSR